MNSFPEKCICSNDCRRTLVVQEKGKSYTAENEKCKHLLQIHVDGGLITAGERCDYALIVDNRTLYLIELKGRDVQHACEQLFTTLRCFKERYPMDKYNCRAVVSKVVAPNKPSPAEKRLIRLQAAGLITYGKRELRYVEKV